MWTRWRVWPVSPDTSLATVSCPLVAIECPALIRRTRLIRHRVVYGASNRILRHALARLIPHRLLWSQRCHVQVPGQSIEADVLAHRVPLCGACKPGPKRARAVMKVRPPNPRGRLPPAPAYHALRDSAPLHPQPDITFFHEPLQPTYGALLAEDRRVVDLLLVMGTSLPVEPIKDLPCTCCALVAHRSRTVRRLTRRATVMIPHRVPQILISRERPRDMRPDVSAVGTVGVISGS